MKTRVELSNIACMTSAEVTGVLCTFEHSSGPNPYPRTYLYKCPTHLAESLKPGTLALAEYEGQQSSNRDRPVVAVLVKEVLHSFDPEDMLLPHKWIFGVVETSALQSLQNWELQTTDTLVKSQRRRAREAVLREVVGELGVERPKFPSLGRPQVPTNFEVVEAENPKTMYAAHEDPDLDE